MSAADPPERLFAVLKRCAEATDASRWALLFARTGARPRTVGVGGRPGALRGQFRRSGFLRWAEVESLRQTHGLAPDAPAVIVRPDDPRVDRDLRERLARKEVTELLVGSVSGAWGAWVYELVADDRLKPADADRDGAQAARTRGAAGRRLRPRPARPRHRLSAGDVGDQRFAK